MRVFASVARATASRVFAVHGKRSGLTHIEAMDGRTMKATLKVTVHPEKLVKVAFHFAATLDGSNKIQSLTRWNPSSLTAWDPKVPFSLATWDTIDVKRLPKVLNIYLVGKWLGDGSDPKGSFIFATKDVVCDDMTASGPMVMLLSHEIGHFLGAGHPPAGKRHWITEMVFARTGNKIPHDFVLKFNPWSLDERACA